MPAAFEEAFRRVKVLVSDFKANVNFCLMPQFSTAPTRQQAIALAREFQ
jgi:hypothetical protein